MLPADELEADLVAQAEHVAKLDIEVTERLEESRIRERTCIDRVESDRRRDLARIALRLRPVAGDEHGHTAEDREDIEKNKGMAILAYIIFLVPLLVVPKSKFARFHANQGLLVFIFGVTSVFVALILGLAMSLLSHILARFDIPFLGWFLSCIVWLLSVFCIIFSLALAVMGIINAANGESKHLPLFGRYQLLK